MPLAIAEVQSLFFAIVGRQRAIDAVIDEE
jgi:hypothetical protein